MKAPEVTLGDALASAAVFVDGDWIESKDQDPGGDVRLIQLADIGDGRYLDKSDRFLTASKARELKCTRLKTGDVLVARMPDPLGRACIFPGDPMPAVTVVDVCIIRPNGKGPDARWLVHWFNSPYARNQIASFAIGTTRSRVSRSNLSKLKVLLPPLSEQRRVADILDKANSLRTKRRAAIAQLDTLTQSIFLNMFGDPGTNPKRWPIKRLEDVTERITKGESPKWQGFDYQSDGALFVTSENVRLGEIDLAEPKFVPLQFNDKLNRSELRAGDLLVNLVGASIGRSCVFPGYRTPANVNQAVAVVTIDSSRIQPGYVAGLLASTYGQKLLVGNRVEAARANISLTDLRDFPIAVPTIVAQVEYGHRIAHVEKLKATYRLSLSHADALFASLQHRAFRGEL